MKIPPKIENLRGKIGVLDRRRQHLEERAGDPKRGACTRDFDKAEASALRAAIRAMEYVAQVRQG